MITVSPLKDSTQKQFEQLFAEYYNELGCGEDIPHLLEEYVIPDLKAGLLHIDILKDGDTFAGFVIYQTDDINNEWNFKEGWGDIREIYVVPSRRRQGLGKFLLYTAEMKLREAGTDKSYSLPCENAEEFFTACGYEKTTAYNSDLGCSVYEKPNIQNKCK
ncbi:MAG: GNAT family N-acetyltransferase [Clostridia bacterium]|nr:GNAT family N-acetyltransferase [Clostridia bacterium]